MRLRLLPVAIGATTIACAASVALAALLNVLIESPSVTFNDDSGGPFPPGATTYTAGSELFSVESSAIAIQLVPDGPVYLISPGTWGVLTLDVFVDANGAWMDGHQGEDLIITGTVDIDGTIYSGTLLTGEAAAFGFANVEPGDTDLYDFRFTVTGGALADLGEPFYGQDIGLRLTSEMSTFTGSFNVSFSGKAKGVLGAIPPITSNGQNGGCTPGYWKQPHHFDSWPAAYSPDMLFSTVFGRVLPNGNPTLGEALRLNGGGLNALIRHSTAALLNATHASVNPDSAFNTPFEVITSFRSAFDSGNYETVKNLLEASNEIGCPLN